MTSRLGLAVAVALRIGAVCTKNSVIRDTRVMAAKILRRIARSKLTLIF
jgi:hypothetical protein